MHNEMQIELSALQHRFTRAASDWKLARFEIAELLGLSSAFHSPVKLSRSEETKLRLIINIDRTLRKFMDDAVLVEWLHTEDETGISPLKFMALGEEFCRGMLLAARIRASQIQTFG